MPVKSSSKTSSNTSVDKKKKTLGSQADPQVSNYIVEDSTPVIPEIIPEVRTSDTTDSNIPTSENTQPALSTGEPKKVVTGTVISASSQPVQSQRLSSGNGYSSQNYQQQGNYSKKMVSGNRNMSQRPTQSNSSQLNNYNGNYQDSGDSFSGEVIQISGMLEILQDYGVIRQKDLKDDTFPRDVYISQSQIRRFNLRVGDLITGAARPPKEGERYLSLLRVDKVEGLDPEEARKRPNFAKLTPVFPFEWLKLETTQNILSTRLIDLVSPIGKGQRAMIVAPPKAGKTWLLRDIANGITANFPNIVLLVALIGERPEEVTHFSRSVKGDVYASNFDEKAEEQTRIAEICLEHAKRLAEAGKDVVILMDSLTRLARAYNMVAPPSGRTLTGGFDPAALYPAKHFFGAARCFEEGGSLTIIATALVDTGSRMDDVIFEEFKGTGNMELRLDRDLAERRVFPAIDIKSSSTRHEEQLIPKEDLENIFRLRRMIDLLDQRDSTDLVLERLKKAKTNKEFLDTLHKAV